MQQAGHSDLRGGRERGGSRHSLRRVAGIITLRLGDITTDDEVDVIVNAANSSLLGGGGVDGAIHDAAGPTLLAECQALGGCDTGDVKLTGAARLPARFVIHAVGPIWQGGTHHESHLLAAVHRRAIEVADEHQCSRVAFPAISTGAYGYPLLEAASVAITATGDALDAHPGVREARFWLFDQHTHDVFEQQLQLLGRQSQR
jgi:O-acetyl-ADP-ribose deacetylase (regulator of RNase III)